MVNRIQGLPDNVVGFAVDGKLTYEDYTQSILPALERALRDREKIRFICQLGSDLEKSSGSALTEEAELGIKYLHSFEKIAVVTELSWVIDGVRFLSLAIPAQVEVFSSDQLEDATAWVSKA